MGMWNNWYSIYHVMLNSGWYWFSLWELNQSVWRFLMIYPLVLMNVREISNCIWRQWNCNLSMGFFIIRNKLKNSMGCPRYELLCRCSGLNRLNSILHDGRKFKGAELPRWWRHIYQPVLVQALITTTGVAGAGWLGQLKHMERGPGSVRSLDEVQHFIWTF